MLGVDAEVSVLPVRVPGVKVRSFVECLRVLAYGEEELCEENDKERDSSDRKPT